MALSIFLMAALQQESAAKTTTTLEGSTA